MTFSNNVKNEIIKRNIYKNESRAILQGLFLSAGSLILSGGSVSFVLSSESENVVNFANSKILEQFSDVKTNILKVIRSFKNKERYELSVDNCGDKILNDLGIIKFNSDGISTISDVCDRAFMKTENSMKAFLVGVFLGAGTVSVPQETSEKKGYGYHFEIDTQTRVQAELIAEIFSNFDIFPKVVERGEIFVVYLKNSDTICDVLGLFGASKTVIDLMNQRVDRDVSNMTNRQINCASANLEKTVNAAVKQIEAIEIIQNTIGLENLPETLCEAALLRLSNPDASLSDLIMLMEQKISKGALAQRFNKIIKIANELGDNDD